MNKTCSNKAKKVYSVSFSKKNTNTLPAGRYFIGDPCYFINDYINELELCGNYELPSGHGFIVETGLFCCAFNSKKATYSVESGKFGIISVELGDSRKHTGDGTFHTFDEPVEFIFSDGAFLLLSGSTRITFDHEFDSFSDNDGCDSVS